MEQVHQVLWMQPRLLDPARPLFLCARQEDAQASQVNALCRQEHVAVQPLCQVADFVDGFPKRIVVLEGCRERR